MKFSMTEQDKGDLFNTGDCLIEVTALVGLTVYTNMVYTCSFNILYYCIVLVFS
jgi:hypothetical protein